MSVQPFDLLLAHRMARASTTPICVNEGGAVSPLVVAWYQQSANSGLSVTAPTPVSLKDVGCPVLPRRID
jgi:2,4-dienoyl-CoA reductase-like NADH-dependent reductase (Old Yellow Enzyme family)